MTEIQNTKNNEKMAEYCKTCVCKSCEQVAELKAENNRLKEEIKEVKKYQYEQEYLEKEIERLKQTLKWIKKIAEEHINTRMLLSDKKSFLEFHNIYKLITKAEEE